MGRLDSAEEADREAPAGGALPDTAMIACVPVSRETAEGRRSIRFGSAGEAGSEVPAVAAEPDAGWAVRVLR